MKRVTMGDLAVKLQLSVTAVSLALRNHASISMKTRERVRALADEMGYRPDPALSALLTYRQGKRGRVVFRATLGCITRSGPDLGHTLYESFFHGARDRAMELGYHLEEFSVATLEQWGRLPRILKSRGIEGLLVPPMHVASDEEGQKAFPWNDFFGVLMGELTGPPELHLVINDQYYSAVLAVQELHALGYRRIGLLMSSFFARHTGFRFVGGYLSECDRLHLPSLKLVDDSASPQHYRENVVQWIKKQRLDVVIAPGDGDILPALREANLRVPEDIAVAFLSEMADLPEYSYVDQNDRQVGIESANQLTDLIRRNERGIPQHPTRLLVEGFWKQGKTTPRRIGAA